MLSNRLKLLPLLRKRLRAFSPPLSAEAFEGLILVGWYLCPPEFAMNIASAGARNPP